MRIPSGGQGFRRLVLILSILRFSQVVSAAETTDIPLPFQSSPPVLPTPPSKDTFYTPPPFYQSAAPGTVLRIREAPADLSAYFGRQLFGGLPCSVPHNGRTEPSILGGNDTSDAEYFCQARKQWEAGSSAPRLPDRL